MASTPHSDRLVVVGTIAGAHGVRGDVRVRSLTEDPDALFTYGPLMDETGAPVLEAAKARPGKDHYIVTPKTSRSKESWDEMKGVRLHVRRSALPAPEPDEFYFEDLVGLAAVSEQGDAIGRVKSVQNFGAGDLLEIAPSVPRTPAWYVPFTLEDVPEVDFEAGRVTIRNADEWADQSDPRKSRQQD